MAGLIAYLAIVFGLNENVITTMAGAVVLVALLITYIIAEGRIDVEGVKNAIIEIWMLSR